MAENIALLDTEKSTNWAIAPGMLGRLLERYKAHSLLYGGLFFVYLAIYLFSSYMYNIAGTQPAVILAPQGIALAAALIFGYATIPITGLVALIAFLHSGGSLPAALFVLLANLAQPTITVFILDRLNVSRTLESAWDFYRYIAIAFCTSTIVPSVYILSSQGLYGSTTVSWSNFWIAGLVSSLILTPFLVRLVRRFRTFTRDEWIENIAVILALNIPTAIITYTPASTIFGINLLIPFCLLLMWIALRGGTFFVTLAMVTVSVSAISGRILGHPSNPGHVTLAAQIVSSEVTLIFFALLYYFIAALDEARRSANQRLLAYTQGLEQDAEAKNAFIAMLGHEIRNPLASLLSSIELLKVQNQARAAREDIVNGMEKDIRSMDRMLDDILDVTRITSKKMALKKEVVPARDMLRRAAEAIDLRVSQNQQRFSVTLPPKNVLIDADPVRMEQVLLNLLHNATKFTPPGGSISLLSEVESKGNAVLVIRIKDTGIGLTKEEIGRIFDPFTQINVKQSITGGIGLGLTIARTLIEMHDGTIDAGSEGHGRGSEFVIRLPAKIDTLPESRDTLFQPVLPIDSLRKNTVLVVDDNVSAVDGLCKLLEAYGYKATAAYTGSEAIERAHQMHPEAIVLDIGLPDLDGYEVARRLRAENTSSMLIALSGYGPSVYGKNENETQFDHYLTKPVSIKDILKVVEGAHNS